MILLLFLALVLTAPAFDAGEGPNKCYEVNARMEQAMPCRWEESRGAR